MNELRLKVDPPETTTDMHTLQAAGTDTLQFAAQPWLPRGNWSAGKGSCKRLVRSSACSAPRPSFLTLDAGDAYRAVAAADLSLKSLFL